MANPKFTFKLEGLSDLLDALAELPKATSTNVLKRALLNAAEPIQQTAQALTAPHARPPKKRLYTSITVSTKLTDRQRRSKKKESKVEVYVGAGPVREAIFEEFGTSHSGAHPFMRPAWDMNKQPALFSVSNELADEIEKARKRLARKAERLAAQMKR